MSRDIENTEDIKFFVDEFYRKVRADSLLSPVFASHIPEDAWPQHLERIYRFWNAILFSEKGFEGNPMEKHLPLPVGAEHFSQWLLLFNETIDKNFSGKIADLAKKRAFSIAQLILFKKKTLGK